MKSADDVTLTVRQARRFVLTHQGLWPPRALEGAPGVLEYVRRAGCLQFDPLDVVGRNPDLVLQARVREYRPAMLHRLLYEERRLVDGWDKMMSIYPVEDWPFFGRNRLAARRRFGVHTPAGSLFAEVRRRIAEQGPTASGDLAGDELVDWPWAPTRLARAALESLFFRGELVVHRRQRGRKVYDLASRHVPARLLAARDPHPRLRDYHDWHVLRRVGSVGLLPARAGGAWLGIPGLQTRELTAALGRLHRRGDVARVRVDGLATPLFARAVERDGLRAALCPPRTRPGAAILAPLDNLLWDRRLVSELFGFDYVWEVYKPAAERRYGYYVLPVLYGDRFVARFEPRRRDGAVAIERWWWEDGVVQSGALRRALARCLAELARTLAVDAIRVGPRARDAVGWLESEGA